MLSKQSGSKLLAGLIFVVVSTSVYWAQAPGPVFQISDDDFGLDFQSHERPHIAAGTNGRFVVAWENSGDDGYGYVNQIARVRSFEAPDTPAGPGFRAGFSDGYNQPPDIDSYLDPEDIAINDDGEFAVVWSENTNRPGHNEVRIRVFDAMGDPVFFRYFEVSEPRDYDDLRFFARSSLTTDSNGDFLVVWDAGFPSTAGRRLLQRRIEPDGTLPGDEMPVATAALPSQTDAELARISNLGHVAVWADSSSGAGDVKGRRFAADGTPLGSEFDLAVETTGVQRAPAVAAQENGAFLTVWEHFAVGAQQIMGRLFDPSGTPLGPEIALDESATGLAIQPQVTAIPGNGGFVVTWQRDTDPPRVFVRQILPNGRPAAPPEAVGVDATEQSNPDVAALDNGQFVVVWDDSPSLSDVFGQAHPTRTLFLDGFESGNLDAWSATIP